MESRGSDQEMIGVRRFQSCFSALVPYCKKLLFTEERWRKNVLACWRPFVVNAPPDLISPYKRIAGSALSYSFFILLHRALRSIVPYDWLCGVCVVAHLTENWSGTNWIVSSHPLTDCMPSYQNVFSDSEVWATYYTPFTRNSESLLLNRNLNECLWGRGGRYSLLLHTESDIYRRSYIFSARTLPCKKTKSGHAGPPLPLPVNFKRHIHGWQHHYT